MAAILLRHLKLDLPMNHVDKWISDDIAYVRERFFDAHVNS